MMQPQPNWQAAGAPPKKKSNALAWILGGCLTVLVVGGVATGALVWWGYRSAKGLAERTLDVRGTGDMQRVAQLWSDVPPMEGMAPSPQVEMPLAVRAIVRPFLDTMMKGLNDGKDAGHWDVAFMTVAGKTPHDVTTFYTPARMQKFGWQNEGGCTDMGGTTFCSFQKKQGDSGSGLLIVSAPDPEHKVTVLYFIRQDAQLKAR